MGDVGCVSLLCLSGQTGGGYLGKQTGALYLKLRSAGAHCCFLEGGIFWRKCHFGVESTGTEPRVQA